MILVATMVTSSYAQGREWRGDSHRDDSRFERSLTYKQKMTISQISRESYQASKPLKAKLQKLEARHQSLIHKNRPNPKKINANIREMEQIKDRLARIEKKSRMNILSILSKRQQQLYLEYERRHNQPIGPNKRHERKAGFLVFGY